MIGLVATGVRPNSAWMKQLIHCPGISHIEGFNAIKERGWGAITYALVLTSLFTPSTFAAQGNSMRFAAGYGKPTVGYGKPTTAIQFSGLNRRWWAGHVPYRSRDQRRVARPEVNATEMTCGDGFDDGDRSSGPHPPIGCCCCCCGGGAAVVGEAAAARTAMVHAQYCTEVFNSTIASKDAWDNSPAAETGNGWISLMEIRHRLQSTESSDVDQIQR